MAGEWVVGPGLGERGGRRGAGLPSGKQSGESFYCYHLEAELGRAADLPGRPLGPGCWDRGTRPILRAFPRKEVPFQAPFTQVLNPAAGIGALELLAVPEEMERKTQLLLLGPTAVFYTGL